eukprot:GHVP01041374.1.p1 GENE.GHVP01041374.1~~GHVP01041374.1.p1  ORF type:complete len:628 (-),score=179.88 GHVP01041374.1:553-2436(-)
MSHPPSSNPYQPYRTPPKTEFQISTPTEEDESSDSSDSTEQESIQSGNDRRIPKNSVSPHIVYPPKGRKENSVLVGESAPPIVADPSFATDPRGSRERTPTGPHSSIGREYGSWTAGGVRERVGKCLKDYSSTKESKEEGLKKKEFEARLKPLVNDEIRDVMELQKQLGIESGQLQETNGDLESSFRLLSDVSSNFRRQVLRLYHDLMSENRRQKEENISFLEIQNSSKLTIETLNNKIKEIEESTMEKEDNISSLESKIRRLTNQTTDDEREIKKLTKELDEVQRRYSKLQLEIDDVSTKFSDSKVQIEKLENFKKVTFEESSEWKEKETNLRSEIQKLESQVSLLKENNEILKTKLQENIENQKMLQEMKSQHSNLSSQVQELKEKNKDLAKINQEFAQEMKDLKKQKEETEETFDSNEALKEEIENLDNRRVRIQTSFEQFIDFFKIEIPEELCEMDVELELLYLEETRKFVEDTLEESAYRMEELECAQLQNRIKQQRIQQLEMRKENAPQRGNTSVRSRSSAAASPVTKVSPKLNYKIREVADSQSPQYINERRSQPSSEPRGDKCQSFAPKTSGTSFLAEKFLSADHLRAKSRIGTPSLTPASQQRVYQDRKTPVTYFQKK